MKYKPKVYIIFNPLCLRPISLLAPFHFTEQVRKHWIGVVIGVAGLLTVVIVAAIYLSSKRGKEKVKKVKMTFYKE